MCTCANQIIKLSVVPVNIACVRDIYCIASTNKLLYYLHLCVFYLFHYLKVSENNIFAIDFAIIASPRWQIEVM